LEFMDRIVEFYTQHGVRTMPILCYKTQLTEAAECGAHPQCALLGYSHAVAHPVEQAPPAP